MELQNFKQRYPDFAVYEKSIQEKDGTLYFLARKGTEKFLATGAGCDFDLAPADAAAADRLRGIFPWLNPIACGVKRDSFGFGDRLGIATPGHIRALDNRPFFPIFAQQSVRELERTVRTFPDVVAAAVIGCFQEGYAGGFGADADHMKDSANLLKAADAGFTFFTIDPSAKINNSASLGAETKEHMLRQYAPLMSRYGGKARHIGDNIYEFTEELVRELIFTYAQAVDFIEECYHILKNRGGRFDFEVSVDETHFTTTPHAHIFVADQLRSRGVEFQNMALRFPGKFEKGIDYKGSVDEFRAELEAHAAIRDQFGPYKMSLHSGSDKFAVYRIYREVLRSGIHVKTSGTSWIEAIRAVAETDFPFFTEIMKCGIENFTANAASYEISADPSTVSPDKLRQEEIEDIFGNTAVRQIIHISYGTIITQYRDRLFSTLQSNEEKYYTRLMQHLGRHLELLS